jgi:hypothetical protein
VIEFTEVEGGFRIKITNGQTEGTLARSDAVKLHQWLSRVLFRIPSTQTEEKK